MRLPVRLVTLICPANLFSTVGLPLRRTDRETLNRINQERANGETTAYLSHERVVQGAGVPHNEFRGQSIAGARLVELIRGLRGWMLEMVQFEEPDKSELRAQFRYRGSAGEGEIFGEDLEKTLVALEKKRLNIRGVWENDQDGEKSATIILGPDQVRGPSSRLSFILEDGQIFLEL